MQWHYSRNNQPEGPVPEAEFQTLVRSGVITDDTLVWHEGMANWQPCKEVLGQGAGAEIGANRVVCAECRQSFPNDQVISFKNLWICAACKPIFFQKIKEGFPNTEGSIWRSGKQLWMSKQAVLPDQCVKCNAPAHGGHLVRNLSWHHPLLYLLIVICNPLLYVLVAVLVSKRAKIRVGVCEKHLQKRRTHIQINWGLFLASVGCLAGGFLLANWGLGLAGAIVMLGSMVYAAVISSMIVSAAKIDAQQVRLRGVCAEYLAELPPYPGQD